MVSQVRVALTHFRLRRFFKSMLLLTTIDGRDCPEIICDGCNRKITVDEDACAYWRGAAERHQGSLLYYHSLCEHPEIFDSDSSAMPIKTFLKFLCKNSGLK